MYVAVMSIPKISVSKTKEAAKAYFLFTSPVHFQLVEVSALQTSHLETHAHEDSTIWNVSSNHGRETWVANVMLTLKGFFLEMARHRSHPHFLACNKTYALFDFKGKWKC